MRPQNKTEKRKERNNETKKEKKIIINHKWFLPGVAENAEQKLNYLDVEKKQVSNQNRDTVFDQGSVETVSFL